MWEMAFEAVIEARAQQRAEQDAAKRTSLPYAGVNLSSTLFGSEIVPPMVSLNRTLITNREVQLGEQQRTRLTVEKERTAQHLEDAEVDAARLRERRDAIVRPDRQLWIGLGVLLYPTAVGIVLPVLTMVGGPTAFTGWIRTLGVLFVTALVWLLAYMAYLAARLSQRPRTKTWSQDSACRQVNQRPARGSAPPACGARPDGPEVCQRDWGPLPALSTWSL
jgi:hypothetical protein